MPMPDQDVVHIILPDQIEVLTSHTVREGPVRVWFILRELERKVVVRDDNLLACLCARCELVLEPCPFGCGVVLEFGQIAD